MLSFYWIITKFVHFISPPFFYIAFILLFYQFEVSIRLLLFFFLIFFHPEFVWSIRINLYFRLATDNSPVFNTGYNYFQLLLLVMATNKFALLKRKEKDVYKLRASKFHVQSTENESTYTVDFCGPQGTVYEIGKWKINLYLPEEYPYKSPSVGFLNRIYHPNIDFSSGSVCLDVINQTWTPMYELLNIFEVFLPQLLTYPNPASPLNQEAAHLYELDINKYNEKVKECINKHALNQQLAETRKKSQQLIQEQSKKEKDKNEKEVEDSHSIDEEGSSLSERNDILDDDELKLY